jgi:hypothetical protein
LDENTAQISQLRTKDEERVKLLIKEQEYQAKVIVSIL